MSKLKQLWSEFKKFISRGNVVDMAVGVIIAGAFTAIVTAMTKGILMPLVNWAVRSATGGQGLEGLRTVLGQPVYLSDADGVATNIIDWSNTLYIDWGTMINSIVDFLLIAVILFAILKVFVALRRVANDVTGDETIIGKDPNAPTGDGGIKLQSTCGFDISQPITVPKGENDPFVLTMKAIVPNGVRKFTVEIESTNSLFPDAVAAINDGETTLDLVNPSKGAINVFTTILPFPYGDDVKDKTEIDFDLSAAKGPLVFYAGTHTFRMVVIDNTGCRNEIPVTLVVEE